MTTAHRPTWNAARGSDSQGGNKVLAPSQQISVRDLAGHTRLKTRQIGQNAPQDIAARDLKLELEEKERNRGKAPAVKAEEEDSTLLRKLAQYRKADADSDPEQSEDDDDDDEESDSDSDEEAELMRELEKIKNERELEKMKQMAEKQQFEEKKITSLGANPLKSDGDFTVKRKWYDDCVFKNQAASAPVVKKRFINDTIRNDFHRKFLDKYIQ